MAKARLLGLFASKAVSLVKAAELSGRSLLNFIEILKSRGITWGEYTQEQQRQDDEAVTKLLKGMDELESNSLSLSFYF